MTDLGRRTVCAAAVAFLWSTGRAAAASVSTLLGTGRPGFSDQEVANPYGVTVGPDGALYVCDLDNQRIRRIDLRTRRVTTVAGTGQRGYTGDGGPATAAALAMPHEVQFDQDGHWYIAERDNHVIRRVDAVTGVISTLAGTGAPGFSGDGGLAARAQLRAPHAIALDARRRRLLVCDIGNHRVRAVSLDTGVIETIGGTGERASTPDGALLRGAPLHGPRTLAVDPASGQVYLALREGNAILRVDLDAGTVHHLAGTGAQGYTGDGGLARHATFAGPKGLACGPGVLYVVDTENHALRRIDLASRRIDTVLGTGSAGDGPDGDPRRCALARPHGVCIGADGTVYVGDSEAHRVRTLTTR